MFSWLWGDGGLRKQALAKAWPLDEQQWLMAQVPVLEVLPDEVLSRVLQATRVMVAERDWQAPRAEKVHQQQRTIIAAQAALLLAGNEGYYFDRVTSIVVRKESFQHAHWRAGSGILSGAAKLDGEAHQYGAIVLAWPGVVSGASDPRDGQNLVVHEFAHHLDGLDGNMGGVPPLPTKQESDRFRSVIESSFKQFKEDLQSFESPLLDDYAAESMAEFFAVSSENFFERPRELQAWNEPLYEILAGFYRLDPAAWHWERVGW